MKKNRIIFRLNHEMNVSQLIVSCISMVLLFVIQKYLIDFSVINFQLIVGVLLYLSGWLVVLAQVFQIQLLVGDLSEEVLLKVIRSGFQIEKEESSNKGKDIKLISNKTFATYQMLKIRNELNAKKISITSYEKLGFVLGYYIFSDLRQLMQLKHVLANNIKY